MNFTRPKWSLTIATAAAMALLLGLGFWQLDRLQQKNALIARIAERMESAPVPAPEFRASRNIEFEYRRVTATGIYRHDLEIPLHAIGRGGRPGYRIHTPLERDSGDLILVNRGWVPKAMKDPASRRAGLLPGLVTVEGILRIPSAKARFAPENQPATNEWYWLDLELAASERQLDRLAWYIVMAAADPDSPGPPHGTTAALKVTNNHLGYMLTWFSLALALAVIFTLYHHRKAD